VILLWRICSKLVDLWDMEWNEDKRAKREVPILLVVGMIIIGAVMVSCLIGYLGGEDVGLLPGTAP